MNTIEYLNQELKKLALEARRLAEERLAMDERSQEINLRLTHLTGAMTEINKMITTYNNGDKT